MAEITELKVDYDDVGTALDVLRTAVSEFETANGSAFSTDCGNMDAMNSDFIKKFSRILECVPGWSLEDILAQIKTFCSDAEWIMNLLQTTDQSHNRDRVEENNG